MSHFEERLEADLNAIRRWVWSLGEQVESALQNARKSLVVRDEDMCYATVLGDYPINRVSRECDRMCHSFIARHLPGAGHLREMAATIRVNVALERLGDYAVTICREALELDGPLPDILATDLDMVAEEALDLLDQSRVAFRDGNADQAAALIHMARQLQSKMVDIYDRLAAADEQLDGKTMMVIFVSFNLFKRVADQAKNICDQTVYAVRGVAKIPKIHKLLFLDQPDSGIGQLAVAIGHKNFPEIAQFHCATPGCSQNADTVLLDFLRTKGLPSEDLVTAQLEMLARDLAGYDLIVSVNGHYHDYIEKVPFHSTALNWVVAGAGSDRDLTEQYRTLRTEIDGLIQLVAGEQVA